MSNLLPPNATITEVNFDEAFSRVENVPTPARTTIDPDNAPASILPWMAWAQSVDNWEVDWTEQQKRAVIKAAYAVHHQKGTIGALKDALGALGYSVQVQEWFNQIPQGAPYTFKILISVDQVGLSKDEFNSLWRIIDNTKNLRSHMSLAELTLISLSNVYCAAAVLSGNEIDYTYPAGLQTYDGSITYDGEHLYNAFKDL